MSVKIIRKFPDIKDQSFSFSCWNRQFVENNVIINSSYKNVYYPVHWTPLSIKCAFNGTENYIVGGIKYSVDSSRYLILNHDTLYESFIESDTNVESFTLTFKKDFVNEVFYSISGIDNFLLDYPEVRDKTPVNFFQNLFPYNNLIRLYLFRIKHLIYCAQADNNLINENLHHLLEALSKVQLTAYRDSEKFQAKKKSTRIELSKRLNLAKDYMYSNFSEDLSLNHIAKAVCLSPHHMLRKFKAHFGITPHQFLTRRRVEAAEEMVSRTSKSITEICALAGFESLSSFGVLFKKYYRFSPENYRFNRLKKSIFRQ